MERKKSRNVIAIAMTVIMACSVFAIPAFQNSDAVYAADSMVIDVSKLDSMDPGIEDGSTYYYDKTNQFLMLYKSGYTITGDNPNIIIGSDVDNISLTVISANIGKQRTNESGIITLGGSNSSVSIIDSTIMGTDYMSVFIKSGIISLNNSTLTGDPGAIGIYVSEPQNGISIDIIGNCTISGNNASVYLSNNGDENNNLGSDLFNIGLNSKLTLINKSFTDDTGTDIEDFAYTIFGVKKSNGYFVTDSNTPVANRTANAFQMTLKENTTQTIQVVPNTTKIHTPKKTIYLKKKTSVTLPVKAYSLDSANPKLTWKSSKKSVATVSQSGKVKAKKKGTAKITVTAENGKSVTFTIKVVNKNKAVKKLTIKGAPKKLKKGKSKYLTVTTSPKTATKTIVKWKSSNKKILTVDKAGKITAKKKGTVKLTAKIGKKKVVKKIKVVN